MALGRLKQINLRTYWPNEALDFTKWLSKDSSLALLSNEVGIEITLERTEAPVGAFSVDILAYDSETNSKVVIENQLERTDHDHLGKIITYASGYNAEYIIWIVKDVRDEHKQAVDWLNENTTANVSFFAIKMELWQIGDSAIAPKFHIISKPNNWAKAVKNSSASPASDLKMLQLNFWSKLKDFLDDSSSSLKTVQPSPQNWYDMSVGKPGTYLSLTINSQKNFLRVGIYIRDNKDLFRRLETQKTEIEATLGFELDWKILEDKRASRIVCEKHGIDFKDASKWTEYLQWFKKNGEDLQAVFTKYL